MGIFKKIQKSIRSYFFGRELKKVSRKKKVVGFDATRKIGILYDCSQEKHYREVVRLVKDLEQQGKTVHALGFVRENKMPEYTMAQLNLSFCHSSDFSWRLKLKSPQLQNFIHSKFDLLIDLSPEDLFLMKFIMGLSDATYKAGPYHEEYLEVYDLMISEKPLASIKELIEHMLHYLKIIKPAQNGQ
jgi:hypothetical protein